MMSDSRKLQVGIGLVALAWFQACGGKLANDSQGPAGTCSLIGAWSTHSAPWNGESTDAVISFGSDGSLTGQPSFTGTWLLTDSTLTIQNTVGPDMTCAYSDHWTLTFSSDCRTAPLLPIDSGCTGSRRYLDWDVTLTRVPVR